MKRAGMARLALMGCLLLGVPLGCENTAQRSVEQAKSQVAFLAETAARDVSEVREGLPGGAKHLEELFRAAHPGLPDPQAAAKAMARARDADPKLRVAKSTFFAVTALDGQVLRAEPPPDDLTGKNLWEPFPGLKAAPNAGYAEARGRMAEVAGVRGKDDAQWVAAAVVRVDGEPRGVYVAGWSWSAYAYRLETALRSKVLTESQQGDKIPLLYVYVVVGKDVFGAPVAPVVNAKAIAELDPIAKLQEGQPFTAEMKIEGRAFGLAVLPVTQLGDDVAIAVLRSET